jgi:hypothetical protein
MQAKEIEPHRLESGDAFRQLILRRIARGNETRHRRARTAAAERRERRQLIDARTRRGGVCLETLDDSRQVRQVFAIRFRKRRVQIADREAERHLCRTIVELRRAALFRGVRSFAAHSPIRLFQSAERAKPISFDLMRGLIRRTPSALLAVNARTAPAPSDAMMTASRMLRT